MTRVRAEYRAALERALPALFTPPEPGDATEFLAQELCLSHFHFHRLFAALVGETPGAFVRRIRLERAAMAIREGMSISEAALGAGYETSQAFAKAFRAAYRLSPTEWRAAGLAVRLPSSSQLHWGQIWRLASPTTNAMKLSIQNLPSHRLAYLEHRGAYPQIGPVFGRLAGIVGAAGLHGTPGVQDVGMYFDDPCAVPEPELRSWAATTLPEDAPLPEGLSEGRLDGERYAVWTHMGSYQRMTEGWMEAYRAVAESGEKIRPAVPFELYVNTHDEVPEEELRTDLHIPIE